MEKKLRKISQELYYIDKNKERIIGKHRDLWGNCRDLWGNCSNLRGDCSYIWGDCSNLQGDCSYVWGDCSFILGNLDDCKIIEEERLQIIDINSLIEEGNNGN